MKPVHPADRSPLHNAVLDDDATAVEALLADGASPNTQDADGFTPLHLAAQEGSLSATAALLRAAASVDVQNSAGNTPLFVAVFNSNGQGDLIRLLRSYGADPLRANTSGQTPVGLARLIANSDVAQFFIDVTE